MAQAFIGRKSPEPAILAMKNIRLKMNKMRILAKKENGSSVGG